MTLYTPKRTRAIGKKRRGELDSMENFSPPSLTVQLLRENLDQMGSEHILHLQGMVGNSATQQLLRGQSVQRQSVGIIQRMPTAQIVESTLGPPKKDTTIGFGKLKKVKAQSTKYKAVLAALRAFEAYTVTTYLARDTNSLRAQMTAVNNHLNTIYNAMNAYRGKKGKKAVYMMAHIGEVKTLQNLAARAFLEKMDKPDTGHHLFMGVSLASFLNRALREGGKPQLELDPNKQVGSMGGGSKTVDKYDMGSGQTGYFSDKKDTLNNIPDTDPAWVTLTRQIRQEVEEEGRNKGWTKDEVEAAYFKRVNAKRNENNLGVEALGIDPNDARMNNRDIAMSRLDQLLGTHLIARAQFAVVNMPDGSKREGSIMEGAKGLSANELIQQASQGGASTKEELIANRQNALGMNDPEFMRQLSRLQLLDIIASQIDRNIGNYFIYRDSRTGELIAITGIDNDFSFGMNTNPDMREQELPGISRYVDKELAQTIINLDPSLLEAILSDLLPQREIDAAITRLKKLQAELQSNLTNLLEPNEWTAHAQDLLNEKKSYYSRLYERVRDTRGARIG